MGRLATRTAKNWCPYTEVFSIWTQTNVVPTDNNIADPYGRVVGALLTSAGAVNQRIVKAGIANPGYYTVCFGEFFHEGTINNSDLRIWDVGAAAYIAQSRFNLNTGTIAVVTAGGSRITPVGGGWYLCEVYNTTILATPLNVIDLYIFVDSAAWGAGTIYVADTRINNGIIVDPYIRNNEVSLT